MQCKLSDSKFYLKFVELLKIHSNTKFYRLECLSVMCRLEWFGEIAEKLSLIFGFN